MVNCIYKFLILLCIAGLSACSEQAEDRPQHGSGAIAAQITWVSNQLSATKIVNQPYAASIISPSAALPIDLITVRIIVTGNSINAPIQADFPASARSGIVSGIPIGNNYSILLQGLNANNVVIYEGSQTNISVTGGVTTQVAITANEVINKRPVAIAGIDQIVDSGSAVTLVGSGIDADGTVTSYSWTQTSGNSVTMTGVNTNTAIFIAPIVTSNSSFVFELTVTDDFGNTGTDSLTVTVTSKINVSPVANNVAINDLNSGDTVFGDILSGSYDYNDNDNDAEGTSTFRWLRNGTAIAGASTTNYTIVATDNGQVLTFEVTPMAATGAPTGTAMTSVGIMIANTAPTANAGVNMSIPSGENLVNLTGSGSDVDGSIASYSWSQTVGTTVAIINSNMTNASFTAPSVLINTALEFRLTVTDDKGATATDDVVVMVTVPAITSTSPSDKATDIDVNSPISATFNHDMFAASIDTTNFTVKGPLDGLATGVVTYDALTRTATFLPDKLNFLTNYTVTMSDSIIDISSNALSSTSWSFNTRDRQWGTATVIETDAGDAAVPAIAMNDSGNAIAVWVQKDGTQWNIVANRYTADAGWGTVEIIETNSGATIKPQIDIDANGNAIAVWHNLSIWANRYVEGVGWGIAELIVTNNMGQAKYPQIAINGSGNAIAVWEQSDGSQENTWANRYVAGEGWGVATPIETGEGRVILPEIATDDDGNAIAVWTQWDGTRYNIWSNRYTVDMGWGTAELIETDNAGGAWNQQIAIDDSGNAIAVWTQSDNTRHNNWSNRYTVGMGWGVAELIETDSEGDAAAPAIAINGSGNAIAVWQQSDRSYINIMANSYEVGMGWGAAELIETSQLDAFPPRIAIDAFGNANAVWSQSTIKTNRYIAGVGWGTPKTIKNGFPTSHPQIMCTASGEAITVWNQRDSTWPSIWANKFE